jgi:low affinity Fe/Cu permease
MHERFRHFAARVSIVVGAPGSFAVALAVLVLWALAGPFCHFSDTWQLVINTGTTIVTFLIVFLIQNTQNRESKAVHLKLDELIRSIDNARNALIDLDELDDRELAQLEKDFRRIVHQRRVQKDSAS